MEHNTKIIVDGVNVSGCENIESHSLNPITLMNEFLSNPMCRAYQSKCEGHNCYFKQLSRKTAECEKYEQILNKIENICKKSSKEREAYKDETCIFHCKTRKTDRAKLADRVLNIINKAKEQ